MTQVIFITGTDTGVGKTVLTALLLHHLRASGCNALAMKPFCSGSRADARLLHSLQKNSLTLDEINPFYLTQPLAPAADPRGRKIPLDSVLTKIKRIKKRCDVLLIEGAGGLLVPLGKNYTVADLIRRLRCRVLVVSLNKLGTINHTLLTVKELQRIGVKQFKIVMVNEQKPDRSARSNARLIQEKAPSITIIPLLNLGPNPSVTGLIKRNALFLKKTLAQILQDDSFITFAGNGE